MSTTVPVDINPSLVRRLLRAQFPQWAELPIEAAQPQGWDNRTFRLGDRLSVRLPSAAGYVPQIDKEHRWLPVLAAHLPLPIPRPVALGQPGEGYPWPWSVFRWLPGEPLGDRPAADPVALATALGAFLARLQQIKADDGPPPGQHTASRGAPLEVYDQETRSSIHVLGDEIDGAAASALWEAALATAWSRPPVWFHGDVAVNNLLVDQGALAGVIDFGCAGGGDPACDTVIAWTLFEGPSRAAFQAALPLDDDTWLRGRGWALWKALITVTGDGDQDPAKVADARRVIGEVLK